MQLRLIAVGKIRERYVAAAVDDFRRRLAPYHRLDVIEIRAENGLDAPRAVSMESAAILRVIDPSEIVWLLERSGSELSSEELSSRIEALATGGVSKLTLVVGGTYGADTALIRRANFIWSLSRLTLLHEWARALVLEQLYRAAKIARGEPYHH